MTLLKNLKPRYANLVRIHHPTTKSILDKGLLTYFPGPRSFTGEDVIEVSLHGGKAVIKDTLDAMRSLKDWRLAEPGEFSKRAFLNGKMDLTEVEGLADLVNAETSSQRELALNQMEGSLRQACDIWRQEIKLCLAYVIAYVDFGDDAKIDDVQNLVIPKVENLMFELKKHINDDRGEQIRDGFHITLIGSPNVGKSSLMNILSKRDASIVSEIKGTTRDIVQVGMNIDGYHVIVNDTAGLHEKTQDPIEQEGIKRAISRAKESKIVLLMGENEGDFANLPIIDAKYIIRVINKIDITNGEKSPDYHHISCKTGEGLDDLMMTIKNKIGENFTSDNILITRARHRECFIKCHEHLKLFLENRNSYDIASEHLRSAGMWIGKLTGEIELDEILDVVFREFCIGK